MLKSKFALRKKNENSLKDKSLIFILEFAKLYYLYLFGLIKPSNFNYFYYKSLILNLITNKK